MPTLNLGRVGFVNKGAWADGVHKINDTVTYNNGTYACILAHTSTAGDIIPTNTTYWQEWVSPDIVHKTGNETIAGIKTFSSSPIIPTPANGDSSTAGATTAFVASAIPYNIHAATSKTTPVDADELALLDSSASFGLKKLTWSNLKATLLSFFTTNNQTFSAYAGASQNLTSSVFTKIQFNTEEFDTASVYDNATNYRFQPTVAGYYLVNVYVAVSTSTTITDYQAVIYKNGAAFKSGDRVSGVAGINVRASATALVLLNGTTDYVEGYMFAVSTGTLPTTAGANNTYFQATLARGA